MLVLVRGVEKLFRKGELQNWTLERHPRAIPRGGITWPEVLTVATPAPKWGRYTGNSFIFIIYLVTFNCDISHANKNAA